MMASAIMGIRVSPVSAISSGRRKRFQLQAHEAQNLDVSDPVNGASVVFETKQNGSLVLEQSKVPMLRDRGVVEVKKRNGEEESGSLAPLWDDGYGTRTVEDYFAVAREFCNCDDGGPPRWFCPVECGRPLKDSPTLLFLPGKQNTVSFISVVVDLIVPS